MTRLNAENLKTLVLNLNSPFLRKKSEKMKILNILGFSLDIN